MLGGSHGTRARREAFALSTSVLTADEAVAVLPRAEEGAPEGPPAVDTFPKLVLHHGKLRANRASMREKQYGIWQTYSWGDSVAAIRAIACGLAAQGLRRGDKIAVIGDNRPQFYWSMLAAQSLGAVPVPVYQDALADEMQFVLDHAEARFALAEDQEQVDKLIGIRDRLPYLQRIIYKDPRGLRHYPHDALVSLDIMQEQGRAFDAAHPGFFLSEVGAGNGSDISVIVYTSGTTGRPKGVMLSFDNLLFAARATVALDRLSADDAVLAYLPMAWVGDHLFSYAQAIVAGFAVNCPESSDTVMTDLKEIGPSYFFAPPRIFENILTEVLIRMEDAGLPKRLTFDFFMRVARRCGVAILEGRKTSLADRMLYVLGNLLVYGPLRNALGLSRARVAYTAGEAIGPDTFLFFRSIGINLKQLYGQTESSAYGCLQRDDDVKSDTAGPPAPGVEMKITEDGEIIYRGPTAFVGYYKNPEATAASKASDGWVHTGDAGVFTDSGHLRVIDRAKDVGRLNNGTLFAPKYLENKLKFFPYIKEAVAFGHRQDFVACLVNIDLDAVGNWAERRGIAFTSYTDLTGRDEVYGLIAGNITAVNRDLSRDAGLAGSQIRRFLILHKELDADDGELTRTRKVRRGTIAERYSTLIAALYSQHRSVPVEVTVAFEDGRTSVIRADLKIRGVETFDRIGQRQAA
jgi:long-chain acyl-CoA synthetase